MDPNQNKKNDKNNRGRMRGVASLILWALVLVVVFQYINAYTGNAANKTTSHEIKYSQHRIQGQNDLCHACRRLYLHRRGRQELYPVRREGAHALYHGADEREPAGAAR